MDEHDSKFKKGGDYQIEIKFPF